MFLSHDLFICNLEGPILNNNLVKISKKGPSISQSKKVTDVLKQFKTVVCLANNHIMDYGKKGLFSTIEALEKNHISYMGANLESDVYHPFVIEKEKIAIFNVCESGFGMENSRKNGNAIFNTKYFFDKIQRYKKKGYLVIILPHAGAENLEYPLPEIRDLYKLYVDLGADLVIGNHPHIVQGKEIYKHKHIYYSLGNLYFNDYKDKVELYNPSSLLLSININDGQIKIDYFFIRINNQIIDIDNRVIVYDQFKNISKLLLSENEYVRIINKHCHKLFDTLYSSYINYESDLYLNTIRSRIKSIIKILFNQNKIDKGWIIHNSINETNRWIISRVIKENYHENL